MISGCILSMYAQILVQETIDLKLHAQAVPKVGQEVKDKPSREEVEGEAKRG